MSFFIATPTRNYGRFLADAIRSIRAQRHVHVRHHVQDASSNDGSVELLQDSGWDGLSFTSEPDRGQCDALNRAFRLVPDDAQYLGWLNADEFYLPNALTIVRRAFEQDPSLDVVYGDAIYVDEHGRVQRLVAQHRFSETVLKSMAHLYINTSSTFFSRQLLSDGQLRLDEEFRQTMDRELFLRLRQSGRRFGYLPVPLSGFRVHEAQLTKLQGSDLADAEHHRIEEQFGFKAHRRVGRLVHRAHKLANGAYLRESRMRRLRGRSLRWFADADAALLCDRLTAYGERVHTVV